MTLKVYIAAPYADGPALRAQLVESGALSRVGAECTSRWLLEHTGEPEDLSQFSIDALAVIAEQNDDDLRKAGVVLLVDPDRRGRETYAEVARAIAWEKPIVWVAPPSLSMWRADAIVYPVQTIDGALGLLRLGLPFLGRDPVAVFDEAFRGCTWPTESE